MVNSANVSCACSRSPMGFSPHCHVGDGCVDVILIRHTSLINNIRLLLRLSSKRKTLVRASSTAVYSDSYRQLLIFLLDALMTMFAISINAHRHCDLDCRGIEFLFACHVHHSWFQQSFFKCLLLCTHLRIFIMAARMLNAPSLVNYKKFNRNCNIKQGEFISKDTI